MRCAFFTITAGATLATDNIMPLLTSMPTWLGVVVVGSSLLATFGRILVLLARATIPQESHDRLIWWQSLWKRGKLPSDH
jgi:hypothetical protein